MSCMSCQSCLGACDSCQSFCQLNMQNVGSFSFNQCINKGEVLLTKNNWNRIIKYLNDAYAKGTAVDGGDSQLPANNQDPNDVITAEMFNKVSWALHNLGSEYNRLYVNQGDVVLGSYFKSLEYYADNLKYKTTQCNLCNAGCNSCNGGAQANYCCSSCDTCQADIP